MANRWFNQFTKALVKEVSHIYAKVTFGATGAPTLSVLNSLGVVSVVRNSTGNYTFTFGTTAQLLDTYNQLLMVRHVFQNATAPAAPGLFVVTNAVASTATLIVQFNSAGSATDPGSGEVAYLEFVFKNSSAI